LKDRYGSQIRTHYPKTIEQEIEIIEQESARFDTEGYTVSVPRFMKEVVAEITHLARRSGDINRCQRPSLDRQLRESGGERAEARHSDR
jgi:magnesium chelatase subunit I